jgi:thiol-disulfide isomerase/thioredoxin
LLTGIVAAVFLLSTSGCSLHGLQGSGNKGYVVGAGDAFQEIPVAQRGSPVSLSGKDLDGKPITLESMRGKPTVVNVWGSWCADCNAEQPLLVDAATKLKGRANFVGINVRDPGTTQGKTYDERYGVTWPSFYSFGGQALLTFRGVITPKSIPSTIVLDAQGRVAAAINGRVPTALTLVQMVQDVSRGG